MPVVGLGIDLIEIHRIEESVRRYGKKFLDRIYTENEKSLCLSRKDSASCLAARFAAKEALYKAVSGCKPSGVTISFSEVEVAKNESGMPYFKFSGEALKILSEIGNPRIHLSITHSRIFAAAIAIIEK